MKKYEAKNKVSLRGLTLGDGHLALIMPIAAKDQSEMLALADEFDGHHPDLLEWRIDYFEAIEDVASVVAAAKAIREKIGDMPLMATIRHHEENGVKEVADDLKMQLFLELIRSKTVDMVDCEARYSPEYIGRIKACCRENGVALMISYHDLKKTPGEEEVVALLQKEVALGADVCKVSFVAQSYGDNANLGEIIIKAKEEIGVPIVSISAGPNGVLSRIAGDVFGSDGTFVSTGKTHQIHISDVKKIRQCLDLDQ